MTAPAECSPEIVDALIAIEQADERCWRVNKYLGSMLTFDFGRRNQARTRRGDEIEIGSSTLGVRDVWWEAEGLGADTFSSDDLGDDPEGWRRLDEALRGATLAGFAREDGDSVLRFSNGVLLTLDGSNVHDVDPDEVVMALRLSGGARFELMPDGRLLLNVEESVREKAAA